MALVVVSLLLVALWVRGSQAAFWPQHVLQPLALALLAHGWVVLLAARPTLRQRMASTNAFANHLGLAGALWLYFVSMWAMAPGYFWPAWPLLGLAAPPPLTP